MTELSGTFSALRSRTAAILACLCLCSLTVSGQDDFEAGAGDDTPANAKVILTNGTPQAVPHTIHENGDQDWVKFTLNKDSSVLCSTYANEAGDLVDTLIILYPEVPGNPGVIDIENAIINDNNPLVQGTVYSGITAFLAPGTYYLAVVSAGTYFSYYQVAGYFPENFGADQYRITVNAEPVPTIDSAPQSLEGMRLIELTPESGQSLAVTTFAFAADTYEGNVPARVELPYTFELRGPSTVNLTRTQEDDSIVPATLVFESPRGGWLQAYITTYFEGIDPNPPNDQIAVPVLSGVTTRRFILETELPPGGEGSALVVRDDLHEQGHSWTYSGRRTYRDGDEVSTPLAWQRQATGKETLKTYDDTDRIAETFGLQAFESHWLQLDDGTIGPGIYMMDDTRRGIEFLDLPIPYLPSQVTRTADLLALPESEILKEGADPGVLYDGYLRDYISHMTAENVTVPFGTTECEKVAILRTWSSGTVGFGYSYAVEWHSPNYGLIKKEFHDFAFDRDANTTSTSDGYYELTATNVTARPPLQTDFDVNLLVELGEGVNQFNSGVLEILPRWLLKMANATPEPAQIDTLVFTNPDHFTNLSPQGAVLDGDDTVWSNVAVPSGASVAFSGDYTTAPILREYKLDLDRQWGPVMVGDGDEVETVVSIFVQNVHDYGDAIDVEITFLGTTDRPGNGDRAAFADLTHVSADFPYGPEDGILAFHTDTDTKQTYRWVGTTPEKGVELIFTVRVRFDLLYPYKSALVEPIVRIKSKDDLDLGEDWNNAALEVSLDKSVSVDGVRIDPQDGYLAATTVDFHHQHIPYSENFAAEMPAPIVDLKSVTTSGQGTHREYRFEVVNFRSYPDWLFDTTSLGDAATRGDPAPRTIVTLQTSEGVPIASPLPVSTAEDLTELFFSELIGEPVMTDIVVHFEDTLTGREYVSAVTPIDLDGTALLTRVGWNCLSFPTGMETRGGLIDDVYGAGTFNGLPWIWDAERELFAAWAGDTEANPETLGFWGHAGDFVSVDFTPGVSPPASEKTFRHRGWDALSVPFGSEVTAADVLASPGVSGIWVWNATLGEFENPVGKLDHRKGYWILIESPPVTIQF